MELGSLPRSLAESDIELNAVYADWTEVPTELLAHVYAAKIDVAFFGFVNADGNLLADQFSVKES